jgi:hypothetical protein
MHKLRQVRDKIFVDQGRDVDPTVGQRGIAEINHDFVWCPSG